MLFIFMLYYSPHKFYLIHVFLGYYLYMFFYVQSVEHFVDIHYILYLRYCIRYLFLSYTCISVTVIVYAIYIYVILFIV